MKPGGILAFVLERTENGDFKIMEQTDCSEFRFNQTLRKHLMYRPAHTIIPNLQTLH